MALTVANGGVVTLGQFARYLESVINWRINVDWGIVGRPTPDGTWNGTLQEVLESFAASAEASIVIDEGAATISLH